MTTAHEEWIVYRCDDNGNTFEVARYTTKVEAEAAVMMFSERGHKQTYWATGPTTTALLTRLP